MNQAPVECRALSPEWETPLRDFFSRLAKSGAVGHFHPHPLTDDEAARRAQYQGSDLYYVLVQAGTVVGYGMLRGWDAGFEVPSLGIALDEGVRGRGLGRALMEFLHAEARRRGAERVRLKVHRGNTVALRLYESLGYTFQGEEAGQLVGYLSL